MNIKFKTPKFKDGVNTTIRRGVITGLSDREFNICDSSGNKIADGLRISVSTLRFNQLKSFHLENEHDESCRTYNGLLNAMRIFYPDFGEKEIVSIINFEVKK